MRRFWPGRWYVQYCVLRFNRSRCLTCSRWMLFSSTDLPLMTILAEYCKWQTKAEQNNSTYHAPRWITIVAHDAVRQTSMIGTNSNSPSILLALLNQWCKHLTAQRGPMWVQCQPIAWRENLPNSYQGWNRNPHIPVQCVQVLPDNPTLCTPTSQTGHVGQLHTQKTSTHHLLSWLHPRETHNWITETNTRNLQDPSCKK
jgi:hypothetical protein